MSKAGNAQSDSEMVGVAVGWNSKTGWCGGGSGAVCEELKDEVIGFDGGSRMMQAGNGRATWAPAWFVLTLGGNWPGQVPLQSRGFSAGRRAHAVVVRYPVDTATWKNWVDGKNCLLVLPGT